MADIVHDILAKAAARSDAALQELQRAGHLKKREERVSERNNLENGTTKIVQPKC